MTPGRRILAKARHVPAIVYPLAYMVLIYVMSSIPGAVDEGIEPLTVVLWLPPSVQNLLHVPLFGVLSWLLCWAMRSWGIQRWIAITASIVVAVAYGFLDEWHQYYVPGRYAAASDMLFNSIGAVIGVWVYLRAPHVLQR